jgi:hypothetical protein
MKVWDLKLHGVNYGKKGLIKLTLMDKSWANVGCLFQIKGCLTLE